MAATWERRRAEFCAAGRVRGECARVADETVSMMCFDAVLLGRNLGREDAVGEDAVCLLVAREAAQRFAAVNATVLAAERRKGANSTTVRGG